MHSFPVQATGKPVSESSKVYFYAQFVAYILGLVTTVVFMTWYKTAQVKTLEFPRPGLVSSVDVRVALHGTCHDYLTRTGC